MNLKSGILKLSIIFMLILLMIPVATAMDSEDAFYIEYSSPDDEVVIEEYDHFVEVDTQVDVSSPSDVEDFVQDPVEEYEDEVQKSHDDAVDDVVEIPESVEDSDVITYYDGDISEDDEVKSEEVISNDLNEMIKYENNNEISCDDLTLKVISVDIQGSFFISKIDLNSVSFNIINEIFNHEITTLGETTSPNKNVNKVLELKNILLTNEKMQNNFDCHKIANVDGSLDVYINKITNDFAYSIDNSVVGDASGIFMVIVKSSFSTFYPCFDATFSRDFLDVECFFARVYPLMDSDVDFYRDFLDVECFFAGGYHVIAADGFCEICFVEYGDLSNIDYNVKFCPDAEGQVTVVDLIHWIK